MNFRSRNLILILSALVLTASGVAALGIRRAMGPVPSLAEITALARAGRFERAQELLLNYLRAYPDNERARMLAVQVATEPSHARPELALEHLHVMHPQNAQQAARIKFFEGKARYQQKRYDLAETCWNEALSLDPTVPEAGWALLDLLDLAGRVEEAHRLGLRVHESEPDARDRVRALLETARLDIDQVAPGSQVQVFEPLAREHPEYLPIALSLGLALVRDSKPAQGLRVLEDALRCHPSSADAWEAWLSGLQEGHELDRLAKEFARLPRSLAGDPRFAKFEGMVAENARNWAGAVRAYRRAYALEPHAGPIGYRLRQALLISGLKAEAEQVQQRYSAFQSAFRQLRGVLAEANSLKTLGQMPHVELYQRLATLREQMGRRDEARAWHRLVLRDFPDDPRSLEAMERLK